MGITRPDAGLGSSKGFCCCSDGSRYAASTRSGKVVKSMFRSILVVVELRVVFVYSSVSSQEGLLSSHTYARIRFVRAAIHRASPDYLIIWTYCAFALLFIGVVNLAVG